jgi:DNA polymerase-3 subunit gamma/tau
MYKKKQVSRLKYTALYRHWRPKTFQEVVGQDPIIKTLKNQIKSERIAHAYLFCGSRGTGKTSTAKILAVAVNCLSPVDGDPCLECDVCKKLSSGNNMDVIEIDAASNNGVDEIRDLRDKVKFPPVVGRYKVYIIDEVHMLSMGAFNALLKTLEEPPDHVVFILATTEPHKLPATVLSRCQRYDFKRISINVMVQRLRSIAGEMGVDVEDSALQTIARWAEGGLRDALSLMDQCMGFCDKNITQQDVLSILGTADQQFVFQMVENILEGKRSNLLFQLDKLIEDGRDLSAFVRDIMQHLRGLLVTKICQDPAGLLDVTENTLEQYRKMASQTNEERLIRAVEALSALEGELRWSNQPRVLLELTLIKICRPEHENSLEALLDRIKTLEQHIASIGDAAGRTQSYAGESEHAAAVLPAKEQKNSHEQ